MEPDENVGDDPFIPVIRFFHNDKLIKGNLLLWNSDRVRKPFMGETLPLHPAVCLNPNSSHLTPHPSTPTPKSETLNPAA